MAMNAVVIPIVMFFPAYFANKWLVGIKYLIKALSIEELPAGDIVSLECLFSILCSFIGVSQDLYLESYSLILFAMMDQMVPTSEKSFEAENQDSGPKSALKCMKEASTSLK